MAMWERWDGWGGWGKVEVEVGVSCEPDLIRIGFLVKCPPNGTSG